MAYLDGAKVAKPINVKDKSPIAAGFYSYVVNDNTGIYTLKPLDEGKWGLVLGKNDIDEADGMYWIEDGTKEYDLAADTPVIDLRDEDNQWSTIESVADLVSTNWNDAFKQNVSVAYVVANGDVQYIYVVDAITYTPDVTVGDNWTTTTGTADSINAWYPAGQTVTVSLTTEEATGHGNGPFSFDVTVGGFSKTYTSTNHTGDGLTFSDDGKTLSFEVTVAPGEDIVVSNWY